MSVIWYKIDSQIRANNDRGYPQSNVSVQTKKKHQTIDS